MLELIKHGQIFTFAFVTRLCHVNKFIVVVNQTKQEWRYSPLNVAIITQLISNI